MITRYAAFALLLPLSTNAQVVLPGFLATDTATTICPWDTGTTVLGYAGWEAYQTLDGTWDGPVDSTVCINLAHVVGQNVEARIDFDGTNTSQPVFLRLKLDSATAIPLTADNEYAFTLDGFPLGNTFLNTQNSCAEGQCTGMRAAVRIPDSTGIGYDLRWYQASYFSSQFGSPFGVCVPTEGFGENALGELIFKFTLSAPDPGQRYRLWSAWGSDFQQEGSLEQLTEASLPQYQTGSASFELTPSSGYNFLAMYEDTTYPGPDHVSYLDITPLPNLTTQTTVTLTLDPFTGFNLQPYTQLRGGAVLNNDTLFHNLTVVNNGADLCLTYQIVELIWGEGERYVHQDGHLGFEGARSCFLFKAGSTLEVAPGATLQYGLGNRGMLALNVGCGVVIGAGAELVMHGMVVLKEGGNVSVPTDLHTMLGHGAKLTFASGSRIFNGNSLDGNMKWVITLDGGAVDLDGLSDEDREKVVLIKLPTEALTELNATVAENSITFNMASRAPRAGVLRCFDMVGRCVIDRAVSIAAGENTITLATPGWLSGPYIAVLDMDDERRMARWVRP